jgi:hypothetical protein
MKFLGCQVSLLMLFQCTLPLEFFSTFRAFKGSCIGMSCPVLLEVFPCFEFFVASLAFEVFFVTVSYEMMSQIHLSFKQLATFWTFKVFNLAVSDRVAFETMIIFE